MCKGDRYMLIDEVIGYCDKEYKNANTKYLCRNCVHPSKCSGNCKTCLAEIHYPNRNPLAVGLLLI